jgi:hypothetical protein
VSDSAREIFWWVDTFIWAYVFFTAGYALYAWFKLRDKPSAFYFGGMAVVFSSDLMPVMVVGLVMSIYGFVRMLPRHYRRMTEKALDRFGPARGPDATRP